MLADMMHFGNEASREVLNERSLDYHPMMSWAGGGNNTFLFFNFLWLATWILAIIALITLIRWLWKKGDKA